MSGVPLLLPGWSEHTTDDGNLYYAYQNGHVSWDPPAYRFATPDGRAYVYDTTTGVTHWEETAVRPHSHADRLVNAPVETAAENGADAEFVETAAEGSVDADRAAVAEGAAAAAGDLRMEAVLPDGWLTYETSDGDLYYVDTDGNTYWEAPAYRVFTNRGSYVFDTKSGDTAWDAEESPIAGAASGDDGETSRGVDGDGSTLDAVAETAEAAAGAEAEQAAAVNAAAKQAIAAAAAAEAEAEPASAVEAATQATAEQAAAVAAAEALLEQAGAADAAPKQAAAAASAAAADAEEALAAAAEAAAEQAAAEAAAEEAAAAAAAAQAATDQSAAAAAAGARAELAAASAASAASAAAVAAASEEASASARSETPHLVPSRDAAMIAAEARASSQSAQEASASARSETPRLVPSRDAAMIAAEARASSRSELQRQILADESHVEAALDSSITALLVSESSESSLADLLAEGSAWKAAERKGQLLDVRRERRAQQMLAAAAEGDVVASTFLKGAELADERADVEEARRREAQLLAAQSRLQPRATRLRKRDEHAMALVREQSAVRLQAAVRGRQTRVRLTREQRDRVAARREQSMQAAAARIQATWRGAVVRRDLKRAHSAATSLQAAQRGRRDRRRAVDLKRERQAGRRGGVSPAAPPPPHRAPQHHATTIQRRARGAAGRRRAARVAVARERRSDPFERWRVATLIQAAARGRRGRLAAHRLRERRLREHTQLEALARGLRAQLVRALRARADFLVSDAGCAVASAIDSTVEEVIATWRDSHPEGLHQGDLARLELEPDYTALFLGLPSGVSGDIGDGGGERPGGGGVSSGGGGGGVGDDQRGERRKLEELLALIPAALGAKEADTTLLPHVSASWLRSALEAKSAARAPSKACTLPSGAGLCGQLSRVMLECGDSGAYEGGAEEPSGEDAARAMAALAVSTLGKRPPPVRAGSPPLRAVKGSPTLKKSPPLRAAKGALPMYAVKGGARSPTRSLTGYGPRSPGSTGRSPGSGGSGARRADRLSPGIDKPRPDPADPLSRFFDIKLPPLPGSWRQRR